MESPKALEGRTLLTGCYGLRQLTTSLRLLFHWAVCVLGAMEATCFFLSLLAASFSDSSKEQIQTEDRKVKKENQNTSNPYFVITVTIIIKSSKFIIQTYLTGHCSVCIVSFH